MDFLLDLLLGVAIIVILCIPLSWLGERVDRR